MFIEQQEDREIIDNTLVQTYIFSFNTPIMITFSPAGSTLTSKQVAEGANAWSYDFFKKNNINILAFSAIDNKHWFTSKVLKSFIQQLTPQLTDFPERLGYAASMGAYALSNNYDELLIDRMLLITPITSTEEHNQLTNFNYANNYLGQLTILVDPFCIQDKTESKKYPPHSTTLAFPGVGHRVIESLSQIGYLKPLIFQFINNDINRYQFSKMVRQRRNISRYYSYMMRNPTKKNSKKRRSVIRRYKMIWSLDNIGLLLNGFWMQRKKSIDKRINVLANKFHK